MDLVDIVQAFYHCLNMLEIESRKYGFGNKLVEMFTNFKSLN